MANIKDYIIKGEIITTKEIKTRAYNPPEYAFTIMYENDTDFIIKRTTQKTDKELVCLVSQAQFYIKDNKNKTIENIIDIDQIKAFKKGMEYEPKFEKLTWKPFERCWHSRGCGCDVDYQFENIIRHKETCKILANKKIPNFKDNSVIRRYENDPEAFNREDECLRVIKLFYPDVTKHSNNFSAVCKNLIDLKIDVNKVRSLLDLIIELGGNVFYGLLIGNHIRTIVNEYKVDLKSLLTWLAYTIKHRNGLDIVSYSYEHNNFSLDQYADYLRMQQTMYGKIKEKYPLYWLSEKQMMNNKYNQWTKIREMRVFSIEQEKMKQYEYEDDVYKVIVPMENTDILDEAEQQQHCVASYIDRIERGETHILFIRQRLNEAESCLTVQVTPDARIIQVRGFQNRAYNKMEYDFMVKWAKEKELKLEVSEPNVEG